MRGNTHYKPSKNGYQISGSTELLNRLLYGSHKNDDVEEKFALYAGDVPQFMGAATDWTEHDWCLFGKRGTLFSGLALTPGQRIGGATELTESGARWFHDSEDIVAEFKNGWMEYKLSQMSPYFPNVSVNVEAYPLLPDDGLLIHYRISTDQRVIFTAGFGGITDYIGRFDYKDDERRYFSAQDCEKNTIELGERRACIRHENGSSMRIATSFPAEFGVGSAKALEKLSPALFLGSTPENADDQIVKISAVIEQGKVLDGFIVALHNGDEKVLDQWLALEDPARYIKQQIHAKHACVAFNTPEHTLNLTIAPTIIALDASWHRNSFHHGTFAYHSPFLGWRGWYAPTALGWNDRVETVMSAHLDQLVRYANGDERIWFDGKGAREGDADGLSPYHNIENSTGFLPYFLGVDVAYYNMQECAFDMMLYYIEWSGNLEIAQKYFEEFSLMLDWEERIFDPDGDGLYQNFLNTWISDGHSYNGGGCAQASAYNYRANMVMAKIAEKLGKPSQIFVERAEKIKKAMHETLWLPNSGVIAEFIDTVGNCLVHPSPELSTIYLTIDCDVLDDFKAYTMLKYTENSIENIMTPGSDGRLAFSSNWYPKKYSTCGIFPAENACLALAYFKLGLREKGKQIVDGLVDCYFTGKNPGTATHVQSALCSNDMGDIDFTDVSSTHLRLMVEGLFGIRLNALENKVVIAPNFPENWEHASLSLKDISVNYHKTGNIETFVVCCDRNEKKCVRIPMVSSNIEVVMLDGEVMPYEIVAAPENCFLTIETEKKGRFQLQVIHGEGKIPYLKFTDAVLARNDFCFEVLNGELIEWYDICECLENISVVGNKIYATAKPVAGHHTLFIHVKKDEYDAWLAADYEILKKDAPKLPYTEASFEPVDISAFFNCSATELHQQEYLSPRPKGYSIGVFSNGRYAWEWNHRGHNMVYVDDSMLRAANGLIHTSSGIPFLTPPEKENLACVSLWDNFPTSMTIPLKGKGRELAILFISTTNAMQTAVENARITLLYADGGEETVSLTYPVNIDDWLVPALQTENETFYFSDYNHGTVQRIRIDADRELCGLKIEAVANEVILGVLGVSVSR